MLKSKIKILTAIGVIVITATAQNDTIYLHDGKEIATKVLRREAGVIEIQGENGISKINVFSVGKIKYEDGHTIIYTCSGCAAALASATTISAQEQSRIEIEGETQSEAALDGDVDDNWSSEDVLANDEISEIMLFFTEGTAEYNKRQKRLAKIDRFLARMAKAGLIMGAFDIFGAGTGTIGGAAAAGAAYGFLNVTRKGVDQIEQAIQAAGGWEIVGKTSGGVTVLNDRCNDRKKEVAAIRKTIVKQAALAAGVSAGVALAVKNAAQSKSIGDIKYGVLATGALALAMPELKLQNQVVKLARQSVESCAD